MSGHADTIREALDFYARNPRPAPRTVAGPPRGLKYERGVAALDALVVENQQQAQATKQLAANLADLQLRLIERNAENQHLRDALALADETIRGLADQQAMPDDFYPGDSYPDQRCPGRYAERGHRMSHLPKPTQSNLPERIVVGANGAYWRDFGEFYSMCPVSSDNDPVEVVAVYVRVGTPSEDTE